MHCTFLGYCLHKFKIVSTHTLNEMFTYHDDLTLFDEFIKKFNPDTHYTSYPIHLEYKIANRFGSFPSIYSKCGQLIIPIYISKQHTF